MPSPEELSLRSNAVELPPGASAMSEILSTEARAGAWRLIELCTASRLPFDVRVRWSSGSGAISEALITVATGTRLCVHAKTLQVAGINHSSLAPNKVCCTVADAFATTFNQLEHRYPSVTSKVISVPSFAEVVRVEVADPALLPGLTIDMKSADGIRHGRTFGDAQPSGGLPIGGTSTIELTSATPVDLRMVFTLTL